MMDNNNSFIKSAYFHPKLLCEKIIDITKNKNTLNTLSKNLFIDYNKRLSGKDFVKNFITALD